MKNFKFYTLALIAAVLTGCGSGQISQESIRKVDELERVVKLGQVQIVFDQSQSAFDNADIRKPGEATRVGGLGKRSVVMPTLRVLYTFTSDEETQSPKDESISFRLAGAPASLNLSIELQTNINPDKKLGDEVNRGVLAYIQAHGGLSVQEYIKGEKFRPILQQALQMSLDQMTSKGQPLTQEEVVFDGPKVSELYGLIEVNIQTILTQRFGASPFTIAVLPARGEGGDKIGLPNEVEEVYLELAKAKAKQAVNEQAILAQQAENKLALVKAEEQTVLLRAHQSAGTLRAYTEIEKTRILADSGNTVFVNADENVIQAKPD